MVKVMFTGFIVLNLFCLQITLLLSSKPPQHSSHRKHYQSPASFHLFLLLLYFAQGSRGGQGSAVNLFARFSTQAFGILLVYKK